MQWQNTVAGVCNNREVFCAKLKSFFLTQLSWIYTQVDKNPNDDYWNQVIIRKERFTLK